MKNEQNKKNILTSDNFIVFLKKNFDICDKEFVPKEVLASVEKTKNKLSLSDVLDRYFLETGKTNIKDLDEKFISDWKNKLNEIRSVIFEEIEATKVVATKNLDSYFRLSFGMVSCVLTLLIIVPAVVFYNIDKIDKVLAEDQQYIPITKNLIDKEKLSEYIIRNKNKLSSRDVINVSQEELTGRVAGVIEENNSTADENFLSKLMNLLKIKD